MSEGLVIDTNYMCDFHNDFCNGVNSPIVQLVEDICNFCGLAVSERLFYEWKRRCQDNTFWIWYESKVKCEQIVELVPSLPKSHEKRITQSYGLPKKCCDLETIRIANTTQSPRYIMSRDIHLYDPKEKNASPDRRKKVMIERSGRLCMYLRSELKITVGMSNHCRCDISGL